MKDLIVEFYSNNSMAINICIPILLIIFLVGGYVFRDKLIEIYKKYKEIINYVIVGVLTTVVSIGSYWLFRFIINNYIVLSIISWILAVAFAYITNRLFVFESDRKEVFRELVKFVSCRLFTLFLEVVLMILFVSILKINDMISKIILQFVVLVLNYVLSKLFVFSKKQI